MDYPYETLMRIVNTSTSRDQRLVAMRDFAKELNWTPFYEFQGSFGVPVAEDHIVVEHGLENSAIISFLKAPHRATDLEAGQLRSLLTISFNNLIEWHIFVAESEVRYINNLTDPASEQIYSLTRTSFSEYLSGNRFETITKAKPANRSLESCDDSFIRVISRWKRMIKADYRGQVDNKHISALFNALILVRGCEDYRTTETGVSQRALLRILDHHHANSNVNLVSVLNQGLNESGISEALATFVDLSRLRPFEKFDRSTAGDLIRDFYRPAGSVYEFNFALMSKHALSRIYERYVSLLEFDEEGEQQLSFIAPTPIERTSAKGGAVYTPQYIAGFFARYLRDNMTPRMFRNLRSTDPACGSGIFLRTLLELQCNPLVPGTTLQTIQSAFNSVVAIDRDPNACEATFLSLALLYLVAMGSLPRKLDIRNADAIRLALNNELAPASFGAVLANPPYVKLDHLSSDDLQTIERFLDGEAVGRVDSYLAFVKLCLFSVENGGYVCLVLPQAFLLARNALFLRKAISQAFHVRCLVDLTKVEVFPARSPDFSILCP